MRWRWIPRVANGLTVQGGLELVMAFALLAGAMDSDTKAPSSLYDRARSESAGRAAGMTPRVAWPPGWGSSDKQLELTKRGCGPRSARKSLAAAGLDER